MRCPALSISSWPRSRRGRGRAPGPRSPPPPAGRTTRFSCGTRPHHSWTTTTPGPPPSGDAQVALHGRVVGRELDGLTHERDCTATVLGQTVARGGSVSRPSSRPGVTLADASFIEPFFDEVTEPIAFEGPDTDAPLAFRWYDADRDRRRQAHDGRPPAHRGLLLAQLLLAGQRRVRRADLRPTVDRPTDDPMGAASTEAGRRVRVLREARCAVLLLPRHRHRARGRLVRGDGQASSTRWSTRPRAQMERTGVRLLWGTANLFSHPRYAAGAATNPDPDVFAHAAAQVAHCLEVTHRLGGANYVLWGGREGYETLLNTDLPAGGRPARRGSCTMVVEHKHSIGFDGTILIEPKPAEPTKHQYDHDVAAVVRIPRPLRPARRRQGQHRGEPRHARRPQLPPRGRGRDRHRRVRLDRCQPG